jgi:hypothetical protein
MELKDIADLIVGEQIKSLRATMDYEQTVFKTRQECFSKEIDRLENIQREIVKCIKSE